MKIKMILKKGMVFLFAAAMAVTGVFSLGVMAASGLEGAYISPKSKMGLKYKKCKSCGKKWTDVIRRTPALGHKPGKVKILKPGCTSVGYKTTNCTRKGCMNSYGGAEDGYLTVETIPALGHSYDKGTSIKIGKKRGGKMKYQKTQKCKRCGKRKISYYYK